MNFYAYVGNNPLGLVDPAGTRPDECSGGCDFSNNALAERALEHHPDSEHHNGYQDAVREYMEGSGLAGALEAGLGREAAFSIAENYMDNRAAGMSPRDALREAFAAADPQISAAAVRDLYGVARNQVLAGIGLMGVGGVVAVMTKNFLAGAAVATLGVEGFEWGVETAHFARSVDLEFYGGAVLESLDAITREIVKGALRF